jgi:hypothetical protein
MNGSDVLSESILLVSTVMAQERNGLFLNALPIWHVLGNLLQRHG